jgi:tRNA modification GTPase
MSGPESIGIIRSIFSHPDRIGDRHAAYGSILDGSRVIDDVVATIFMAPRSFTGEDVVEISCHGNGIIVNRIITLLIDKGCRMAGPGEFSQRAFLNGRMDLTAAEAINHIITARSDWEVDAALNQAHGSLKRVLDRLREQAVTLRADIEAGIDFSQEDIEFVSREESLERLRGIYEDLFELQRRMKVSGRMSRGIDMAVAGRPNVGKSSILNMIVNEERAIVSDLPGTTRDMIRESVMLGGIPVNIVDTAGINETEDHIEKIGIERTLRMISDTSLVLMVLDASAGILPGDREIIDSLKDKKVIFLLNKSDLVQSDSLVSMEKELGPFALSFSAKQGTGLAELEDKVGELLGDEYLESRSAFVADLRTEGLIREALSASEEGLRLLENREAPEITASVLNEMITSLGEITGEITPDDLLGSIFNRFCIGK